MADQFDRDIASMQKIIASKCNDDAWNLIERSSLDPSEISRLLTLAGTARHLWSQIGQPNNIAHADLLFAWALARSNVAEPAVHLARKTVAYFESSGETWERAFAHGAMAAACAARRIAPAFEEHYSIAQELGASLSGPDATYFKAAFGTVAWDVKVIRS